MNKFFLTIMSSWGSDTPSEVFWALNEMLSWAKTKGFTNENEFTDPLDNNYYANDTDPVDDNDNSINDTLIKDLIIFFDNLK